MELMFSPFASQEKSGHIPFSIIYINPLLRNKIILAISKGKERETILLKLEKKKESEKRKDEQSQTQK